MLNKDTAVEKYRHKRRVYFVKREDLVCNGPGPPSAKIRGLIPALIKLKEQGIKTVGYMDTAISMGGWCVAYATEHLGMSAVLYYPCYKNGLRYEQKKHLEIWNNFGATKVPIYKPQLLIINSYKARKHLYENYPNSQMLPNGLTFVETIEEVAKEVPTIQHIKPKTIVIAIGSGAMTAGVIRGFVENEMRLDSLIAVSVHKGKNLSRLKKRALKLAGYQERGGLITTGIDKHIRDFSVVDCEHRYEEKPDISAPFPCNPYYEFKSLKFLYDNLAVLKKPVLFWNIGA